jgi:uncharacterized membrane protein YphA (DoxX/SURF4 family)
MLAVGLVLLRVAAGWHFYREGTKKLAYDTHAHQVRIADTFSAEPFLRGAVGPWADFYRRDLPSLHRWEYHLTVAEKNATPTKEQAAAQAKWNSDNNKRRKAIMEKGEAPSIDFLPTGRATRWGEEISSDWGAAVERFCALPGVTDDQAKAAKAALAWRRQQLADILADEDSSIADWQHELWRLQGMKSEPEGKGLPFEESRIADKQIEVKGATAPWVAEVRKLEGALEDDLRGLLTPEQASNSSFVDRVHGTIADPAVDTLHTRNVIITCVVIGVGVCLMLGLATRLAALAGIVFLLMVMGAQPPWVDGARTEFFYYQLVEVFALGVLMIAGAGRWAGLDFLLRAMFGKRRAATEQGKS